MRTFVIEGKPLEEVTIKVKGQSLTLTEGVEVTVIVVVASQQPLAPDAVCVCGNTAFYEDKVLGVVCTHCQAPRR